MASAVTNSNQRELLDRRSVLAMATGAAATVASNGPVSAAVRSSDIVMMDGVALAGAIRSRQVSCVEVMTAYLDHIEKLNPKVNAIVALQNRTALLAQSQERDAQLARGELMGPLHGFGRKGFGTRQGHSDDTGITHLEGFRADSGQHYG